jgi:rubrerythrin
MNHEPKIFLGVNRTGTSISPLDSHKTIKGAQELSPTAEGDASGIAANRISYIKEAQSIGSIPLPLTLKGITESIQEQIMTGNHALMDKLGERAVFERIGTRLYEALIVKYEASEHKERLPEIARIQQFFLEELKHFQLVSEMIIKHGGDPTALTPAADISSVASAGWSQVIMDPRTTFLQSLEMILQAELIDNAGWELLIEIAERSGLNDLAIIFQQALDEEAFHLVTVKQWVQELTLNNEIISPEQNFQIKH